jgi:hypothetical protein
MLVVIAVIGVWLGVQTSWISQRRSRLKWIQAQAAHWSDLPVDLKPHLATNAPWQIRVLGAAGLERVCVCVEADKVAVTQRELERLFPEAKILVITPGPGYKGRNSQHPEPGWVWKGE